MALDSDSQEINLIIEGQVFKAFRNVLCEHSDYFAAMFSGNYVEQNKTEITIDVIDAHSMDIILRYINIGLIDLSEFSLETIKTLSVASNYLQVTELNKQIEYWLELQLSVSNWMEIMIIAEKASYIKLEQLAGSFGLLSFKHMKPEYIPNLQRLFWYLSHPYLDTESELDVFKFGYKWILHPETCICADVLLIILGCMDIRKITCQDMKDIILLMDDCENSLAAKVVECFKMLLDNKLDISLSILHKFGRRLRESFSERVFAEVYNMIRYSTVRQLIFTPVTAVWAYKNNELEFVPHYLYKYSVEKGFEGWLEVADKNMWGWNMANWGSYRLVLVCGEYGKGMGRFMNDVKVYDTLKQEWIQHGVTLPSRRHAGVAVNGDHLFIVGGVGPFRVLEDSTIIYDLKKRSFRKAAKFPEAIQSPAVCSHYGSIYGAGYKHVYKYEDVGERDSWVTILQTDIRLSYMISYKGYIYCSQNYFVYLYRFRPGIDTTLETVTHFCIAPVGFCNMGNHLLAFTGSKCAGMNKLFVERYNGPCKCPQGFAEPLGIGTCCIRILWEDHDSRIAINDVAGCFGLVMSMPKLKTTPSDYHKMYIARYGKITYELPVEEMPREP